MHTDSRNPVTYYCGLRATAGNKTSYAFSSISVASILKYNIHNITSVMYIDKLEVMAYEDQYISLADYDKLKAKLENLERKHAKLKRRHDNLGGKYLVVKEERNYLIDVNGYKREDFTE